MYENALRQEFQVHENWMNNEWWSQNLEPALKKFANEYNNVMWLETVTFGGFLDGQNANASTRTLQESMADSLKNYTPSEQICKFGTLSRSLAMSESKGKANQLVMAKRSINRQLGEKFSVAAEGEQNDRNYRLKQFQTDFCDKNDFGGGMVSRTSQDWCR